MTIPSTTQIQDLFGMMLDREVVVERAKGPHKFLREASSVGVYVDDGGEITGCCACDLSLTSYAGAALAMLPASQPTAAAKKGEMDPVLADHMHEMLNVMASLFPSAGGPHVRLSEMLCSPPLPKKLAPVMRKPSNRVDLTIKIDGYKGGRMILFAA